MGREERRCVRLQLPSRWMGELGAEAQRGPAAAGGAVTGLHHSWFARTDVSRDAGGEGGRSWENQLLFAKEKRSINFACCLQVI